MLALHDYYVEKHHQEALEDILETEKVAAPVDDPTASKIPMASTPLPRKGEDDLWALAHLNILHVQPILEAFDDDGTGFVSIREANAFTASRPADWRYTTCLQRIKLPSDQLC